MDVEEMRDLFRGAGLLPPLYQTVSSASKATRELSLAILSLMVSSGVLLSFGLIHNFTLTATQRSARQR